MSPAVKTLPLGSIVEFKSGGTPSKAKSDFWGGDFPWVSAKDLKSPIITDSIDRLTREGVSEANMAPKGSLLILVRGMTLYKDVPVCLAGKEVAFNQDIKALIVSEGIVPLYLLYYLTAKKANLLDLVDSAGHGTGRLDTDTLKRFPIRIPPMAEQTAIVGLLSTWDQAIEKIERLITAKEKWFSWLGQVLIVENKERHGWSKVKLGDICKPVTRKNNRGETNILTSSAQHGLVSQLDYYSKSVSGADLSGYYLLKKGEFAYNRSSANGYPYGAIKRLDYCDQGVFSTLYLCFKISDEEKIYSDFLCHYFESGSMNRTLREICQAGARSHGLLNVSKDEFFDLKLFMPPIDQQKRIAAILNAAQQEIDLLKKQLEAYRKQKRDLMQKLLTGHWRVKK